MATSVSEERGSPIHVEPPADIEAVHGSIGSAPAQTGGARDISETERNRIVDRGLLKLAIRGDWEHIKRIFEAEPQSMMNEVTSRSETVLHVATLGVHDQFVENLVGLMPRDALERDDHDGRTALHNAVLCGRIRMVKALVRSNSKLTQLREKRGRIPLQIAAVEASMHKEIAWFLAKNTTNGEPNPPFSSPTAIDTIIDLTYAGHHDITLFLLMRHPHLITMRSTRDGQQSVLDVLASMGSHFPSGTRLSILEAFIYKCIPVNLDSIVTEREMDKIISDEIARGEIAISGGCAILQLGLSN